MAVLFDLDPAAITDGANGQPWSGTVNGKAWSYPIPNQLPLYQPSSNLDVPFLLFYGPNYSRGLISESLSPNAPEWAFHVVIWPLNADVDGFYNFTAGVFNGNGRKSYFNFSRNENDRVVAHAMMDFDSFPGIEFPSDPFLYPMLLSMTSTGSAYKNGVLIGQTAPQGTLGDGDHVKLEMGEGFTGVVRVLVSDSATVDLQQDMNTLMSQYGIVPPPPTSVSWTAGHDGGSPITGYVARFLVNGEVVEQEVGPEVLSVNFPEGTTAVQVSAVNDVGFSTPVERVF